MSHNKKRRKKKEDSIKNQPIYVKLF